MSSTSELMAEVSLTHSYQELFQVTGTLQSLVLRTEDMWQKHNQCHRSWPLNQGFPFSPLMSHFRGLQDSVECKFLDCIPHSHRLVVGSVQEFSFGGLSIWRAVVSFLSFSVSVSGGLDQPLFATRWFCHLFEILIPF